jgi:serine/threonine-protein kinase RsbT
MRASSQTEAGDRVGHPLEARIAIDSDADIVTARLAGREMALALGFSSGEATLIATVISELTRNVVQYAGRGDACIHSASIDGRGGIVISVRDDGPGIADVDRALEDGFSSSGRLGLGLPGVRRLMDEVEIDTSPGRGTRICATKWKP